VEIPLSTVEKAYLLPQDREFVKFVDDWRATEMPSGDWQQTLGVALKQK
jgi:hypothetical protein